MLIIECLFFSYLFAIYLNTISHNTQLKYIYEETLSA